MSMSHTPVCLVCGRQGARGATYRDRSAAIIDAIALGPVLAKPKSRSIHEKCCVTLLNWADFRRKGKLPGVDP